MTESWRSRLRRHSRVWPEASAEPVMGHAFARSVGSSRVRRWLHNINRRPLFVPIRQIVWSLFRFDGIETGLQILELTRFLDANRSPLRLKTLWFHLTAYRATRHQESRCR